MEIAFDSHHRYRIDGDSKIETGSNRIYKAQDLSLMRPVCIKVVPIEGSNPKEEQRQLQIAENEIRAMVQVSSKSPKIPQIYTSFYCKEKSEVYIVMQWIEGETLRNKMNLGPRIFLNWMKDLGEILEIMQRQRIYHKDIKPENIMIHSKGELFLIDFNISISKPNTLIGTEHYKAPEMGTDSQYMNRDKVDIFSIGVIMYEYFTGELPLQGKHYGKKRRSSKNWDIFKEPIEINGKITKEVNDLIVQCMKYIPRERFHSYGQLISAIKGAERGLRYGKKYG